MKIFKSLGNNRIILRFFLQILSIPHCIILSNFNCIFELCYCIYNNFQCLVRSDFRNNSDISMRTQCIPHSFRSIFIITIEFIKIYAQYLSISWQVYKYAYMYDCNIKYEQLECTYLSLCKKKCINTLDICDSTFKNKSKNKLVINHML